MVAYKFYDTDSSGQAEYDITGDNYYTLLKICFKYCSSFSFLIKQAENDNLTFLEKLETYRLPITESTKNIYSHYREYLGEEANDRKHYEIRHYRLTPESQKLLIDVTDSMFKWICGWGYNNPDDLAFFRSDGSAFFTSLIHEGECTLMPTDDENIETVINNGPWEITNNVELDTI